MASNLFKRGNNALNVNGKQWAHIKHMYRVLIE